MRQGGSYDFAAARTDSARNTAKCRTRIQEIGAKNSSKAPRSPGRRRNLATDSAPICDMFSILPCVPHHCQTPRCWTQNAREEHHFPCPSCWITRRFKTCGKYAGKEDNKDLLAGSHPCSKRVQDLHIVRELLATGAGWWQTMDDIKASLRRAVQRRTSSPLCTRSVSCCAQSSELRASQRHQANGTKSRTTGQKAPKPPSGTVQPAQNVAEQPPSGASALTHSSSLPKLNAAHPPSAA